MKTSLLITLLSLSCFTQALAFYNPTTGRWLSRDPIEERGGENVHGFVANRPVGWIDTDGRAILPPWYPPRSEICLKFDDWYEREKTNTVWLKGLAACPCRLTCVKPFFSWSVLNPDPALWHDPSILTFGYHPGAKWCMRSKAATSGAGQQCCFDSNGKLITHGPGAGTPDKVSPDQKNFGSGGHQEADVEPYDWALKCDGGTPGANVDKYIEVRAPNNANGCGKNP